MYVIECSNRFSEYKNFLKIVLNSCNEPPEISFEKDIENATIFDSKTDALNVLNSYRKIINNVINLEVKLFIL